MKLFFITRDFPHIFGAVGDNTFHLAGELAKKDHYVYVITSKSEKICTHCNDNVNILPVINSWNFSCIFMIFRVIKKINPDWVILQYVPQMYSRYALPFYIALLSIFLKINRVNLCTVFHEVALRIDYGKPKYLPIAFLGRLIAFFICLSSKKVITSIESYRKMLCYFKKEVYKIPLGSNVLPFDVPNNEKELLKKQLCPSGEILISTYGFDCRRNDLLVNVAELLLQEKFLFKFIIIGFSEDWVEKTKLKLRKLGIDNFFYFSGIVDSAVAYRFLSISDIFVSLNRANSKGWGGVSIKSTSLAAAYSAGLPIVANFGDMTDEFFRNGDNIFLLENLNVGNIASAFKLLIKNNILLQKLSAGSRRAYLTQLSWSVIAEKYNQLIRDEFDLNC